MGRSVMKLSQWTVGPLFPPGSTCGWMFNMSIKLRTKSHPDGEWVTRTIDDNVPRGGKKGPVEIVHRPFLGSLFD